MLANERLIFKMLLEQKIKLITSADFYKSSPVDGYEFPVASLSRQPLKGKEKIYSTQFPDDGTLACSWNSELIEQVFTRAGEEVRAHDSYAAFLNSNDIEADGISESHYLTSAYLSAKFKGLENADQTSCFQDVSAFKRECTLRRSIADCVMSASSPDVVLVDTVQDAERYLKNTSFMGLVYGIAETVEETVRFFNAGCSFVYLKTDFTKELVAYLDVRTKDYRKSYAEYRDQKIKLKELDRRAAILEIFDEEIINRACDRVMTFLRARKYAGEGEFSAARSLSSKRKAEFDELEHAKMARKAARESIVLIKNERDKDGSVLPLKKDVKVALIGEFADEISYQNKFFSTLPTAQRLPIDVITNYPLNCVGYAMGYCKEKGMNEDIVSNAAKLCAGAEYAIVFLSPEEGKQTLPDNQILLLKAFNIWHIKVIAVVAGRCADVSFADNCKAVLFTGFGGQECINAAFDIITGKEAPSGRLASSIPYIAENGHRMAGYPVGFGLTYTSFEYRNMQVNEGGVSCTVENKGDCDAYAVVQLYIQNDGMYSDKTLKGFKKVFIKKHDAVKVTIPFDENTFSYYDDNKECYRTEGGEYKIFISENSRFDKLTGSIKIAKSYGKHVFNNKTQESVTDGSNIDFTKTNPPKESNKLSFGVKLFLAIVLFLYCNGVCAALLFTNFVPVKSNLFYYILGGIALLFDVLWVVYVAVISVKHSKEYVPVNDTLTHLVEHISDFNEVSKQTYPRPVDEKKPEEGKEEKKEEKKQEEKKEEKKAEEKKAKKEESAKKQEEEEEEHIKSGKEISLTELCTTFRKFTLGYGISVDVPSVRRLFAALAACKTVIVSSYNRELVPDFLKAVNGFFGGVGVTKAKPDWNAPEDLLWRQEGGKNYTSAFAENVKRAAKERGKMSVAVVANVTMRNLSDYFYQFIDHSNSPSEPHYVDLDEEKETRLPENLIYVLSPMQGGLSVASGWYVANASVQIDVALRTAEAFGKPREAEPISYFDFCTAVREARERAFITEKNWKKLDSVFETIAANEKFYTGNKNTLQFEKFSSTLMECGADESEALMTLILCKIVPILKCTRTYDQEGGDKVIFSYFEKAFPDEDLSVLQRALADRPKPASDDSEEDGEEEKREEKQEAPEQEKKEEPKEEKKQEPQAAEEPKQEAASEQPQEAPADPFEGEGEEVFYTAPQEEAPAEETPTEIFEEPAPEYAQEGFAAEFVQEEAPQEAYAEAPQEEVPQQEAPEQEASQQEAPEQEAPQQEAPEQEAPQEEAPQEYYDGQEGTGGETV